MTPFSHDLRVAFRGMRGQPGLAIAILLTLALGIGVNASVFSIVEATLLRPLPYPQADRLMFVDETREGAEFPEMEASYPDYLDWRARTHAFEQLAGFHQWGYSLSGHGAAELISTGAASSNFFPTLGVQPALGRTFSAEDEREGAPLVAILSHGFWQSRFAGRADVIGQQVVLDGKSHTIIGILPRGFAFAPIGEATLWAPFDLPPTSGMRTRRNLHWLHVVGRLRPGMTIEGARSEMSGIAGALAQTFPDSNHGSGIRVSLLADQIVGKVRPILLALLAGVGLVVLIVSANVASLMLARSFGRQRELAIRQALGASRLRMVRQLLTESLLHGLAGGFLGLLVALWGAEALVALVPPRMLESMPFLREVRPDLTVVAYTLLLALVVGTVAGLVPALQIRPRALAPALAEEGRGTASRGRRRVRAALVAGEIGLAFALFVSAGLVLRSLWHVRSVDPGFDPHGLLTVQLSLPDAKYPENPQAIAVHKRILEAVTALPGVERAGSVSQLPLAQGGNTVCFRLPDRPAPASGCPFEANIRTVSTGYFETMRVPLLGGRRFDATDDAHRPTVAIVNRAFAARAFAGQDPVGKEFVFTYKPGLPPTPIVGLVGDEKQAGLDAPTKPTIYVVYDQDPSGFLGLALRSRIDPTALAGAVRKTISEIDPDIPIVDAMTMDQRIAQEPWMFLRRFPAVLAALFALLALALAAVGIHGVMAHSVLQRRAEIGIRRAVGARERDIVSLVLRDVSRMLIVGVVLGAGLALACGRTLEHLLFGVRGTDPLTIGLGAIAVVAVALLATVLPLRRAMRIDPMDALR